MPDFVPKPDSVFQKSHLPVASCLQDDRIQSNQLGKYPYPRDLPPYQRVTNVRTPVPFIERLQHMYEPRRSNREPQSLEEPEKHCTTPANKLALMQRLREMSIERA